MLHGQGTQRRAGNRPGEDREGRQDDGRRGGAAAAHGRPRLVDRLLLIPSIVPRARVDAIDPGVFFGRQEISFYLPMVAVLRSVVTYLVVLAYIAVAGPLGLLFAAVFRWKRGLYSLGHLGVRLALTMAGIRYRVAGRENVPAGAVVFCSNHESNVDPPVLFKALHPRLHVLYKAELHRFPIMGTAFDVGGFVPIERGNR